MRLFVGVVLPQECLPSVEKAAAVLDGAMGARLLPSKNFHFTLCFIGEVGEEAKVQIEEALSKVEFTPFPVSLFGAGAFPSERVPRAIYIGGESEGAAQLAEKVRSALSFLPLKHERFAVHLTVARSKGIADVEDFIKNTGEVCGFEARSFWLMRSILGAQGAIYERLREYKAKL